MTLDFIESLAAGAPSSRHALAQVPEEAQKALVNDIGNSLKDYIGTDGVSIPMESHLVLARS